ncbi:GDSL family lipase [Aeromicrobium sp. A1-2]|uniref:SGNH/GDSL hydrolase family protein n=1 Tax=Aeromicrobium sp. A1-2 TaxID=2107713 RepID=UPI000E4866B1|nr:SGNH/GDSL hydrolase family protein [Aeromicrobium sp. A1-2]AXT85815.1 GDSL family lipase [Aeromicrobium sp. A1-2]
MPRSRKIAKKTLIGGGATLTGFYGFLVGEALLARRSIGTTDDRPPSPDGLYGDDLPGDPIRVLVLGDSAAVGYGVDRADATPSGMIGLGLAHVMDAPVEVQCRAVVGAQTSDLIGQIDLDPDWRPAVTVIIVGTNDVTHQVTPRASARMLAEVVRRLVAEDCAVVVGTCPDLGTVQPILQPLRTIARWMSRALARKQTIAVVEAGGRAVSLGDLLGTLFTEKRDVMFGADEFHPSETGYANVVSVLIPAVSASLRQQQVVVEYAGHPGDLTSVADAAAVSIRYPGTQVVRDAGAGGRFASVLRRRRVS